MDQVYLSLSTSGSVVGGYVESNSHYTNDPTYSITGSGDGSRQYSFVDFDLKDLPSYAVAALVDGSARLQVQFTTSTSNISAVTVKAYAAPDNINNNAVPRFIHAPGSSLASLVSYAFEHDGGAVIDTVSVRHSFGPAVPAENENQVQTIDVTQQAIAAIAAGTNLVVYFAGSGGVVGASTNITNVSANINAVVGQPDSFSDANTTQIVGFLPSTPFQDVTLASTVPASLAAGATPPPGDVTINYETGTPTTTYLTDGSVARQGTEYYLITQSDKAAGVLSGAGLVENDALALKSGEAAYVLSGTAASASSVLDGLVFTPAAGTSAGTSPVSLTLYEYDAGLAGIPGGVPVTLGVEQVLTPNSTSASFGASETKTVAGSTQIVANGGIAYATSLVGTVGVNGLDQGMQIVSSGGVASGTVVVAGNVYVSSGGLTLATSLPLGGLAGANATLETSNETVYAGGSASGTIIGRNAQQIVSAQGYAGGSVVQKGGTQTVGGTASGTQVQSGGTEAILAGAVGSSTLIASGGQQTVGGTVSNATVSGTQIVADGGRTIATSVQSGGLEAVTGTASATSVASGGGLLVEAGGRSVSATIMAGGSLTAASGSTVSTLTIGGGFAVLQAGATAAGNVYFKGTGTLEIDTPPAVGTTTFAAVLDNLAAGDELDLTGLAFTSASAATISGATLTVTNGRSTELFKLQGTSLTSILTLSDGKGGTEVLSPRSGGGGGEVAVGAPLIAGGGDTKTPNNAAPFPGIQVSDPNYGAVDTATIQLSDNGATGTLSGPGITGGTGGRYTITAAADALTTDLRGVQFRSVAQQPNTSVTVDFGLTVDSSAGTSASDDAYSVTVNTRPADITLTGSAALTVASEAASTPFASVTIADPNANSTETVTIRFSNALSELSGPGLTVVNGSDTLSGSAAQVTSELQALVYTPAVGQPNSAQTMHFSITDVATAGLSTFDSNFAVTNTDPAIAPSLLGGAATTVSAEAPSQPFATATVYDPNAGSTDQLAITLSGAGGTLSGAGLSGSGSSYSLSGTATDVTTALQALVFTPAAPLVPGTTGVTNFDLVDTTTPGPVGSNQGFSVSDNSSAVPCYGRGTRIATDRGEVAVEALEIGDRVMTASGAMEAVTWIGRRSYAGRFLAGKRHLLPILFRAGCLGDGLPRRDLRVSPCHAMFMDGVLIPASCLVNGRTILQDTTCARVDYFHIELEQHDVILAEGAPSETFLDDDSRGMFHNAHEVAARPPAAERAGFCAARVEQGHILEAVRQRLLALAARQHATQHMEAASPLHSVA